jgi:metal-responsive CopG/Arc/MetJ family transcriptional regulator
MKTAISLPDNLFRKADQYAKSHGCSRSELFAKAVEQYLEVHPSDHITKQLKGTLKNGLFAQTLRYAQNFILGISTICLR